MIGQFIVIPGMQFQLIPWTRCFWTSSLLIKFNMSIHVETWFQGFIPDHKNNSLGGHFQVVLSKYDKNCSVTFVPSNFSCHILSHRNSARKSIIREISEIRASQSAEIDRLVISIILSDIFFISVVLSYNPLFNNKPGKENLQRCER